MRDILIYIQASSRSSSSTCCWLKLPTDMEEEGTGGTLDWSQSEAKSENANSGLTIHSLVLSDSIDIAGTRVYCDTGRT
jgi:hypothetical protein